MMYEKILDLVDDVDDENEDQDGVKKVSMGSALVHFCHQVILFFGPLLCVVLVGFLIVGFTSLRQIMVDDGIWANLCEFNGTIPYDHGIHIPGNVNGTTYCQAQIDRYNFMFIVSTTSLNLFLLLAGPLIDFFPGPKFFNGFCCCVVILGQVLFGISNDTTRDCYILGMAIIATGGCAMLFSYIQLSAVLPKYVSKLFLALVMSAQDTSAIVFLVFQYITESSNITLSFLFVAYIVVTAAALVFSCLFLPCRSYLRKPSDKNPDVFEHWTQKLLRTSLNFVRKVLKAIFSWKFFFFFLWSVFDLMMVYFYFSSFKDQLLSFASENNRDQKWIDFLVKYFSWCMLFCGVIVSIVAALLMENVTGVYGGFCFFALLLIVWSITSNIPIMWVQLITVPAFAGMRALGFVMWTAFMVRFYPEIASSLLGICAFFAALLNFSNVAWTHLALDHYLWWNLGMQLIMLCGTVLLASFTLKWEWKEKKKKNISSAGSSLEETRPLTATTAIQF